LISAAELATWPAMPTSVWMRTYALTTSHHLPNVVLPSQAGTSLQAVRSGACGAPRVEDTTACPAPSGRLGDATSVYPPPTSLSPQHSGYGPRLARSR
jgi:hypothetical protein